jgi:hypothetical protein
MEIKMANGGGSRFPIADRYQQAIKSGNEISTFELKGEFSALLPLAEAF